MARQKGPPTPPLPGPPATVIPPEALRELQLLDDDPLSTGFTRRRNREILETAIFYSQVFEQFAQVWEKALRWDKYRAQNTAAQTRWREKNLKPKEANHGER